MSGSNGASPRPGHLLDIDEMSAEDLELIVHEAEQLRSTSEAVGLGTTSLRGRRVALLFAEPSTRTRLSFEVAGRKLGAETYVLEPGSSSLVKGETLVDTVRNLDALGFDYLVLRHHRAGAPWVAARYFGGSVVNAGDGWHAHPTQALLDLVTLRRALGVDGSASVRGCLRGRKVVIVGDLLHSRVARSNIWTLNAAEADLWLCGPREWLRGFERLPVTLSTDLDACLPGADAVMGLRVQKERMAPGVSLDDYMRRYQITDERLARAGPGAWFLHPGPINEGIEVTRRVARGSRSLVLEQVRNGVPVRMAVLARLQARGPRQPTQTSSATRDLSSARR